MITVLVLLLLAAAGYVLKYIRGAESNSVSLAQTDVALSSEKSRVAAMEAAAADDRRKRRVGFDVKASAATTPSAAADLLRDVTADDPKTN